MADRGRTIPHNLIAALLRLARYGHTVSYAARELGVDRKTARKYMRKSIEVSPPFRK